MSVAMCFVIPEHKLIYKSVLKPNYKIISKFEKSHKHKMNIKNS